MTVKELPPYSYSWKLCAESGDFEARCREIPDLSAYGETPEEAMHEIKTAVCGWLEVLQEDGHSFPVPLHALHAPRPTGATGQPSRSNASFGTPSID